MPVNNSKTTARRGFPKGKSGNPKGRPKGALNKVTRDAKTLCIELVSDPAYQARFQKAWRTRTLPARLEELVWAYAFGKPTGSVEVTGSFDHAAYLANLTPPGGRP